MIGQRGADKVVEPVETELRIVALVTRKGGVQILCQVFAWQGYFLDLDWTIVLWQPECAGAGLRGHYRANVRNWQGPCL